ncbi:Exodeoxyribonuclease I [hydrothermal vent metagenome]|uniref:Exodeoxyribonuclease I n=1 Tax=hydrothermal vent metagenome TaxID=652676 RepID=A0A3B0V6T7_9ZZZZ
MSSFYWYDLETFGISPQFDRIAQFAGIRTDLNLNPIGNPDMFYCKPALDTIADPEACLITGITPQECWEKGILEKDFIGKINDIFTEPQTCVAGYNSIRFDDEFIRYSNYRNLIDPYVREWANGNSRWDAIDLVRACYALRGDGINWPMHKEGKPSFKLTDLTAANNMKHTSAHDALSDVEATIQMVKLVKNKQPKLFDYCLKLRNKNFVKSLLNWQILKPIVHISSKIPAQRGCLAIMLPLAIHPTNPNGVICYDLAHNPDDLFALDIEDIRDRIFTPQSELPDGLERIALKTIHVNKSPIVAPLGVLKDVDLARIKLEFATNKQNLAKFKAQTSIMQKAQEVFNQPFDNDSDDVDTMLYSGFFSNQDKQNFSAIRGFSIQQILDADFKYKDKRAKQLVERYIARNYPESLSAKVDKSWKADIKQRLYIRFGEDAHLWFEKLNLLKNSDLSQAQLHILDLVEADTRSKLLKLS